MCVGVVEGTNVADGGGGEVEAPCGAGGATVVATPQLASPIPTTIKARPWQDLCLDTGRRLVPTARVRCPIIRVRYEAIMLVFCGCGALRHAQLQVSPDTTSILTILLAKFLLQLLLLLMNNCVMREGYDCGQEHQ